ncbi:MAG: hypothetical protein JWQ81_5941 [Amycolatopsis sp.]|jgi:hypothetical protein|uniref:hypothetical protein n=1 Tax=Amycolatopsis sp. TaxID=37632 RepID=UPI00263324CE|nr:hypothetical protein [Amycolatopsis sp.]MCU1685202.1 hypothetical protein [Amycolatopsis sp.]
MDEVLSSTLQRAVAEQLDYLDHLVDAGDEATKMSLATHEISRLTTTFRTMLADHAPDEHGLCRACRTAPWRRAHCGLLKAAYSNLIGNPADHGNGHTGRHSLRISRTAIT